MVRLKAVAGDAGSGDAGSFQFHYGTIKRLQPLSNQWGSRYFNSTMVRLKV